MSDYNQINIYNNDINNENYQQYQQNQNLPQQSPQNNNLAENETNIKPFLDDNPPKQEGKEQNNQNYIPPGNQISYPPAPQPFQQTIPPNYPANQAEHMLLPHYQGLYSTSSNN